MSPSSGDRRDLVDSSKKSVKDSMTSSGRSPSPTKGMRDSAQSLEWDHCADTKASQGQY